jgi:uncharacterized membrane protein YbaN (DUF454 family)
MVKIKKQLKKAAVLSLATLFLFVGLLGLVLPILQGWFFLGFSLILFSMYSITLRLWIHDRAVKYPRIHPYIHRAQEWTSKVFGAPEI